MSDEKVLDFATDHLPEAVRREMEKMERQRRAEAAEPLPVEDTPAGPEPDDNSPMPTPGDPYQAFSRAANKMVPTLNVLAGDGRRWGLLYSSMMEGPHWISDAAAEGDILVMRFNVGAWIELRLFGHNLGLLHSYLGDHRIRWVREVPSKRLVKREPSVPVIVAAKISKVEEWPPAGMV